MRVAIIYNEPGPDRAEHGVLAQVQGIDRALRELGDDPHLYAVVTAAGLADFLSREHPDVVFNCCESVRGVSALEMSVAALYDLFGIAYTGSSALTLGIALNKGLTKSLFGANGIPTPRHVVLETVADLRRPHELAYPLIVKPIGEDASIGIDAGAVVNDGAAAAERVKFVWSTFKQPALAEEFIDGRELSVALLADSRGALETLPISEISFEALPPDVPAIVSYDAKRVTDSVASTATPARCPAVLDTSMAERARQLAVSAAHVVGLRDYGRVDIRVRHRDHALFVLEVNPNPDLSGDAGFMRAAVASGRTVAATIQQILSRAIDRARTLSQVMASGA